MEELIVEVQKYPCLYDKKLALYKDSDFKSEIWRKISTKLKISGKQMNCESAVHNLTLSLPLASRCIVSQ